jgi:hypothetical protein
MGRTVESFFKNNKIPEIQIKSNQATPGGLGVRRNRSCRYHPLERNALDRKVKVLEDSESHAFAEEEEDFLEEKTTILIGTGEGCYAVETFSFKLLSLIKHSRAPHKAMAWLV